ncbi:hypothetical protein BsWGS_17297 [Bradybaena similaris]
MSACDHFTQNAWRPDLCSTCQRAKSEHEGATGPRSWRRKSEPNPNNAITGVRISALASKFQAADSRNGHTRDAEIDRAKTLDRKTTRNKEKVFNTSRSTELLDSSVLPSSTSSSSSSTTTTTCAISSSTNRATELKSETVQNQIEKFRSKNTTFPATALPQSSAASATSSSITTNVSTIAATYSEKTGPSSATTGKPKLTSSTVNSSNLGTAKTSVLTSSSKTSSHSPASSSESSLKGRPSVTSASSSAAVTSNRPRQPGKEPAKKAAPIQQSSKQLAPSSSTTPSSTSSPLSSSVKSQQTDTSKEPQSSKKQQPRWKQRRRVSIPDREPDVIGNDGGLDNLIPEEEMVIGGDDDHIYLSLTDEEKQFALLALGNTLWNSDTRNLQVEADTSKRACREFEDLSVDDLWSRHRFKSLLSCDPVRKKKDFGTFPQVNASKNSKVSVGSLSFASQGKKTSGQQEEGNRSASQTSIDNGIIENGSGSTNSKDPVSQGLKVSGDSRTKVVGSGLDSKVGERSNSITGGSDVETRLAFSSDHKEPDVLHRADFLGKSRDGLEDMADKKILNSSEKNAGAVNLDSSDPKQDPTVASSHGIAAHVGQDECLDVSLTNSSVQEEFQAVALLNEVLKVYGELNESSTDDFGVLDSKKGKKSSDFEARMASVAATLDLTKQQQRGKRQAPRPSVSPPPEPNLSEGVSPKKVVNQPDPVFKMVTVGKSIVSLPPQPDMPPMNTKPALISYGLEDFGSLSESSDNASNRGTNGDGKSKKGITSFFRNILRRGKDSTESFDSANPDVQLNVKTDRKASTDTVAAADLPDEDLTSSSVDQKVGPKFSPQAKFLVIPMSPAQTRSDSNGTLSNGTGDSDSEAAVSQSEADTVATPVPSFVAAIAEPLVKSSPPTQRKNSKGLASPKMMMRNTTAKSSPPTSHHTIIPQEKEQDVPATSSSAKQYPAPKPSVPPPAKPSVTSVSDVTSSATSAAAPVSAERSSSGTSAPATDVSDKETVTAPNVVRRRPKSPKRFSPPVPPTRTSAGTGKSAASDSWGGDGAKEQESKQRKSAELTGGGTLPRSELRESTRRSLPVPPSPPGERKASVTAAGASSPPVSPIKETLHSLPSSPSSPALSSFDFTNSEWSGGSTTTIDDEPPKFSEKIELPTVATQGRKGILGKLGGNRKTKAPQPPSVKRAKSITQSSTLPRGDKKSKKINVADISGPVLVTDVTNSKVLENRRNTISLGDEPAFISLSTSAIHTGSTNSSASVDKSGLDEFDFPVLSPLGSLENLYESILPKPEGNLLNFYDPPTGPKVVCPNVTSDGYLEPVPPLSASTAASVIPSTSALSLLGTTATNVSSSSSTSSTSSMTTNASVIKSPLVKSKTSSSRTDRSTDAHTSSKDSCTSSHGSVTTSSDSSEANSTENSGGSLPDTAHMSSWNPSDVSFKGVSSGLGPHFVEPEMTEQRRLLLASQPIYEEIPNGDSDDVDDDEDDNVSIRKDSDGMMRDPKMDISSRGRTNTSFLQRAVLPEVSKNQIAQTWLQQQQPRFPGTTSQLPASLASGMPSSLSSSTTSIGGASSSPSHTLPKQNSASSSIPVSSSSSMSSSQIMSSSLMTTSLTSSMLPPPPPPPVLPPSASRSISKETVSSESDTQSVGSNDAHSSCSTWSRPRPVPRLKPKRPDTGVSDQYISMNKPNAQVSLSEDKLRDVFTKLTSITFHALQDIYAQFEKILSVDRLDIPNSKMLKWADFDIYGQPLHASGRCIVYNAKLKVNSSPCQILILHSRPATEMCMSTHPSLLRPSAVFADTIPFSYLTPDFIKTSQLLQNSVYDSSQARCFIAVGAFDIVESLDSHLALLRETLAQDLNSYLNVILTATLQLLSAMSHCLDQGFSVTETDYDDVFLITRSDLRGKVVAFLPRQRSLDVPQGEAICNFLDRLLIGNMPDGDDDAGDSSHDDDDEEDDVEKIISNPKKVVSKLRSLLGQRKVECLGQVRTTVEYLLWGPAQSELPLSPTGAETKPASKTSAKAHDGGASKEQELYVWLEKERLLTVARLARSVPGLAAGLSLEEFYTLKFLLKTSPGCLAESLRRLSR